MNCKSCGVQNVEYATTCYSCGGPLGGRVLASIPSTLSVPSTHSIPSPSTPSTPSSSTTFTISGARARAAASGLRRLMRFAFFAVIVFLFFRQPIGGILEVLKNAKFEPHEVTSESSPPAESAPAAAPQEAPAPPPAPPAEGEDESSQLPPPDLGPEVNGFHMKLFAWNLPEGTSEVHFGDVVRGQSQIVGFEVSKDNRIDVTMHFTFRDPKGKIVEQSEPTHLAQPMESDTLYSTFDYTIPAKGPAGDYDLEIGVDDAVSGRAARFHNTVKAVR